MVELIALGLTIWLAIAVVRAYRRNSDGLQLPPIPRAYPRVYPLKYVFRPDSAPEVKELERAIVKCAMSSDGIVSPSEVVAAYSEWGLDEVRARLDAMANKGYVEMRATKSGSPPLAYVVPEFLADASRGQLAHDGHAPTVSSGRPSGTVQNQSRISPCSKVAIPRLPFPAVQGMLLGMREEPKKPVGRPRKYPWPEPIPDDPENIMRIIMRTPARTGRARAARVRPARIDAGSLPAGDHRVAL